MQFSAAQPATHRTQLGGLGRQLGEARDQLAALLLVPAGAANRKKIDLRQANTAAACTCCGPPHCHCCGMPERIGPCPTSPNALLDTTSNLPSSIQAHVLPASCCCLEVSLASASRSRSRAASSMAGLTIRCCICGSKAAGQQGSPKPGCFCSLVTGQCACRTSCSSVVYSKLLHVRRIARVGGPAPTCPCSSAALLALRLICSRFMRCASALPLSSRATCNMDPSSSVKTSYVYASQLRAARLQDCPAGRPLIPVKPSTQLVKPAWSMLCPRLSSVCRLAAFVLSSCWATSFSRAWKAFKAPCEVPACRAGAARQQKRTKSDSQVRPCTSVQVCLNGPDHLVHSAARLKKQRTVHASMQCAPSVGCTPACAHTSRRLRSKSSSLRA